MLKEKLQKSIAKTPYLQKLRPYQQDGYIAILEFLSQKQKVLRQSPTGSGKSFEICAVVRKFYEFYQQRQKKERIIILVHTNELVVNLHQQLKDFGVPTHQIGVIKAGWKSDLSRSIQIASVPTLSKRWHKWENLKHPIISDKYFNLIIADECHHSPAQSWSEVWRRYPFAHVIGWSATPEHEKGFKGLFDALLPGKSQIELAHLGFQPYWKSYGIKSEINLSNIEMGGSDYKTQSLNDECEKALLKGDILKTWQKHVASVYGRVPTICFAASVKLSKTYTEEINKSQLLVNNKLIKAVHVDGSMNKKDIVAALRAFVSGDATYLINCAKLTEGFDLATYAKSIGLEITSVGCIQDLAPTCSVKRHKQKVGRARGIIHNGKKVAIYLDHWGAYNELGTPDCPYLWSLEGKPIKEGIEVKRCPDEDDGCGATDVPKADDVCPHCGYIFPAVLLADNRLVDDQSVSHNKKAELLPLNNNLLKTLEMLLKESAVDWAIAQLSMFAPSYKDALAICQHTEKPISEAFAIWLKGQRAIKNNCVYVPDFEEFIEILQTLTITNKRLKNATKNKPLHTYNAWIREMRSCRGRRYIPTTEQLVRIAEICNYSPKWAYRQKQLLT